MKHTPLKTIDLKFHPEVNEKWVQEVIADNPSILGLGDLVLIDIERTQRSGGRLDLLFREIDGPTRYEVELQLGATDETHIIRTIEYWDLERRRYPNHQHVGVLIAEKVTTRFLNVISLFNGFIPLMALQMTAITTGEGIGLHFTKVVDALSLEAKNDEEIVYAPTDRAYWERMSSSRIVQMADNILTICKGFDTSLDLKYNKAYIGFTRGGITFNFASCAPKKSAMNLAIKLEKDDEITAKLEKSGLNLLDYDASWGAYRIKLIPEDTLRHQPLLTELLKAAYENR